jgi:Protein of unknown function (DUF4239)
VAAGAVNLFLAAAVIVGVTGAVLTLVLFLRRIFPVGGVFTDSDRAAGIFGVLGTAFAVLLAFVIFLSFETYGNAKHAASVEAVAVQELYRDAQLFAPEERETLEGELICYARAVIDDGWRAMREEQRTSRLVDEWVLRLEATSNRADLSDPRAAVGYEQWNAKSSERRDGRRGRVAESTPFVPPPLWFALLLGAGLVLTYGCCYADRGERYWVQAVAIGSLTVIVTAGLLTVRFFDLPYQDEPGSIRPIEMQRTLEGLEELRGQGPAEVIVPCDDGGRPV